jgi:hypothetical protein
MSQFSDWVNQVAAILSRLGWSVTVDYSVTSGATLLAVPETALVTAWNERFAPYGGRLRLFYSSSIITPPSDAAQMVIASIPWTRDDLEAQRQAHLEALGQVPQQTSTVSVTSTTVQAQPQPEAVTVPPSTPGKQVTTAEPSSATSPEVKGDPAVNPDVQVVGMSGGGLHTWDEWDYYYYQVTGQHAPAPEARGYQREADGSVKINGRTTFTYAEWKQLVFGAGEGAPITVTDAVPGPGEGGRANLVSVASMVIIGILALRGILR